MAALAATVNVAVGVAAVPTVGALGGRGWRGRCRRAVGRLRNPQMLGALAIGAPVSGCQSVLHPGNRPRGLGHRVVGFSL